MALRTFRIMGQAYSLTDEVSVLAEFNGVLVHDGVVLTTATVEPDQNTARDVMIEFDVEDTLYNKTVSSSFVVSGGTFIISGMMANKTNHADLAEFNYMWQTVNQSPMKTNITVDGILVDIIESYGWHYRTPDGSTITMDWKIPEPYTKHDLPGHVRISPDLCVAGKEYRIRRVGSTDFTQIGASDNRRRTQFVCTKAGSGSGSVYPTGN